MGGISVSPLNPAFIQHSIVSGNTNSSTPANREADLSGPARLRYTLLGRDNPSAPGAPPVNEGGSIIGTNANPVDAKLGPLADNGGPTLTHMLLPGSPAINAGDPALTPGADGMPQFDQRGAGFGRIAFGRIDMGAVEASVIANSPPVFTSPDKLSVAENTVVVATLTATDADLPPQTLTFALTGGADAAKFTLSTSGVLSFKAAQDYEVPGDANGDRVYEIGVRVEDGLGGAATQALSITLTPVNDHNPVFVSPDAISVVEDSLLVMPVTATDGDLPAQQITFATAGGDDADHFVITPSGSLSFVDPPIHAAPTDANGDNVYLVTIQAFDGAGGSTYQQIAVTVTAAAPPATNADFNDDGTVDADDLAIWRENFGTIGGSDPTLGDADGDRDVDGNDFLIWQRTLGQVVPPASAAVAPSVIAPSAQRPPANPRGPSFSLDSNVLIAIPTAPGPAVAGERSRRRIGFRPANLPSAYAATAANRVEALSSPAATDAALADPEAAVPAVASALDASVADSASLDDVFAAAGEF